jgi:hypothetical protein
MAGASTAHTVTLSLVGLVLLVAVIVVWRLVVHDPRIRKVRFGVFYERDRTDEEDK